MECVTNDVICPPHNPGGEGRFDKAFVQDCRKQLGTFVQRHGTEVVIFDVTGVRIRSSSLLGLIAAVWRTGVDVQVLNPSGVIPESLWITRLDELVTILEGP